MYACVHACLHVRVCVCAHTHLYDHFGQQSFSGNSSKIESADGWGVVTASRSRYGAPRVLQVLEGV